MSSSSWLEWLFYGAIVLGVYHGLTSGSKSGEGKPPGRNEPGPLSYFFGSGPNPRRSRDKCITAPTCTESASASKTFDAAFDDGWSWFNCWHLQEKSLYQRILTSSVRTLQPCFAH